MVRTQVQLREEQMETLREWAAERRVSIAELIRQSVDMLIRSSRSIDGEQQRRRAVVMVGRYGPGLSDVSSEHDRYLAEAYEVHKQ